MSSNSGNKSIGILYWSHKAYCAGNTVTALIQCRNIPHKDTMVSAQAYGHIYIDSRWIANDNTNTTNTNNTNTNTTIMKPSEMFKTDTNFPLSKPPKTPKLPKTNQNQNQNQRNNYTFCIFTTPMEILDRNAILNDGILIQFDIPHDALPTYKGVYTYICVRYMMYYYSYIVYVIYLCNYVSIYLCV